MIGSLRGAILDRSAGGDVLIEVGGVGYRCTVTVATAQRLGAVGDEAFVFVHHHIREDSQALYAFLSNEERLAFEALISAHGVGPKLALDILTTYPPNELRTVLAGDDVDALCLVPGVGKKTATRLLVELKSKLDLPDVDLAAIEGSAAVSGPSPLVDVRDALAGLGYSTDEIRTVVADLEPDGDSAALLQIALRRLATGK